LGLEEAATIKKQCQEATTWWHRRSDQHRGDGRTAWRGGNKTVDFVADI